MALLRCANACVADVTAEDKHSRCSWRLQVGAWHDGGALPARPQACSCTDRVTLLHPALLPLVVSAEGTPTILYTGVRLRSSPTALPPPPPDQDAGLLWIESQCAAVPEDPGESSH